MKCDNRSNLNSTITGCMMTLLPQIEACKRTNFYCEKIIHFIHKLMIISVVKHSAESSFIVTLSLTFFIKSPLHRDIWKSLKCGVFPLTCFFLKSHLNKKHNYHSLKKKLSILLTIRGLLLVNP